MSRRQLPSSHNKYQVVWTLVEPLIELFQDGLVRFNVEIAWTIRNPSACRRKGKSCSSFTPDGSICHLSTRPPNQLEPAGLVITQIYPGSRADGFLEAKVNGSLPKIRKAQEQLMHAGQVSLRPGEHNFGIWIFGYTPWSLQAYLFPLPAAANDVRSV